MGIDVRLFVHDRGAEKRGGLENCSTVVRYHCVPLRAEMHCDCLHTY